MIGHFYQPIPGWFSIEQQEFYKKVVRNLPDNSHVVEVGAWMGKSSSYMAVEIINSGKTIKFDCVDHWQGSIEHKDYEVIKNGTLYEEFLKNTAPVDATINPIKKFSIEAARDYPDASLDMVFLDGSHELDDVIDDICAWLPKIKPGGILAGDDFNENEFPGVVNAVQQMLNDVQIDKTVWIYTAPVVSNLIDVETDEHINLLSKENSEVETYIIAIQGNKNSETQLQKCIESCKRVGQKYNVFYGYDGTDRKTIKTPDHLKSKDYMKWIKLKDHGLSITEVACALSHLAVWAECMTIDKPIIVLEHDALMVSPFKKFKFKNSIQYLGHQDQLKQIGNPFLMSRGLHAAPVHHINYNFAFARGFHCYAIDPLMARRLFSQILQDGLINAADVIAEITKYSVVQDGIYGIQNNPAGVSSSITPITRSAYRGRKDWTKMPGVTR